MRPVYLDHLSTTPLLPAAWEAMRPYFAEAFGNPASLHQHGLRARDALSQAREQVAAFIHAESPAEILFTSGGTEAANLAVKGVAYANQRHGNHLVVSAIEHPAVLKSVEFLEKQGFTATRIAVDALGCVDPQSVRAALTDQTTLIAVHHVNHEIGTIEPIAAIGQIAAERGIAFFVDATASGGWCPIDVQAMGATLLSLSPHRFHGPKGVGILYRNRRARLVPIQHGGVQEEGRRAGTENVPAIVGAGVAAAIADQELVERATRAGRLQQRLWEGLKARVEYLKLNGPEPGPRRSPTSLHFSTEFIEGEAQELLCDTHGIAVASGSSCLGKSQTASAVLTAIGLPPGLAKSSVLVSFGRDNTEAEIDYFLDVFAERVVKKLRAMSPAWDEFARGLADSVVAPRGPAAGGSQN